MIRTDNPLADFDAYMCEQYAELQKLPKCYECGEPIQSEHAYEINDELLCEDCLINNHRKWLLDILEEISNNK